MFALRLKELRENAGLSQAAFAKKLNISQSTVGMWESGKREPNLETTQRIADFFKTTTDYLIGKSNSKNESGLDKELQGIDFALYGEVKDLTEEEKNDILSYIRFKKTQRGE